MKRREYEDVQNVLSALMDSKRLHNVLRLNSKERELYTQAILTAKSAISGLYHRKLEENE